jgi:hypothetical protein
MVRDRPGEAHAVLAQLARSEVNLLAFNAIPMGMEQTQLVLFPEDANRLARVAEREGITLQGPQHALVIRGDDQLGVFAEIHRTLADVGINVSASSGLTDGKGGYCYLLYFRAEDIEAAAGALGV